MSGIRSKAASGLENKKKYNGIEFENDLELNVYDAQFRELDAQTGRWWQIDPKTDEMYMWSTYASNFDNPIRYEDPLGDEPEEECCAGLKQYVSEVWNGVKERVSEYTSKEGLMSLAFPVASLSSSVVSDPRGTVTGLGQTVYNGSLFGVANNAVNNPKELGKSLVDGTLAIATEKIVGKISKVGNANLSEIKAPEVKGLDNPFKKATLTEVRNSFENRVSQGTMESRGPNAYVNKKSGYSYNVDKGGIYGRKGKLVEKPHVDVNYPKPKPKNVPSKKKLDVAGQ